MKKVLGITISLQITLTYKNVRNCKKNRTTKKGSTDMIETSIRDLQLINVHGGKNKCKK